MVVVRHLPEHRAGRPPPKLTGAGSRRTVAPSPASSLGVASGSVRAQQLHRVPKRHALRLHHPVDDRPARLARPQAVPEVLLRADDQRRGLVLVERAGPMQVRAVPLRAPPPSPPPGAPATPPPSAAPAPPPRCAPFVPPSKPCQGPSAARTPYGRRRKVDMAISPSDIR